MKKLIACLLGGLMLLSVAVTPVASTQIISEKPCIVMIDDFYTISLVNLMKATKDLKAGDTLHLYSQGPGGNAFVAVSMMNYLESLKAKGVYLKTTAMGLAASANALIWLMGDEREVHENDIVMLHGVQMKSGYGGTIKDENLTPEQRKVKQTLNHKFLQLLIDITRDPELASKLIKSDHWFDGVEVYKMGLATRLI